MSLSSCYICFNEFLLVWNQDTWISLLHHVCNQHEWADGHCDHEPITEENHQLPWFERRSKEFEALQKKYPGSWPSWKFRVLHQIQVYTGNPVFIRKTKYISYFNTLVYSNIMFMDDCYGVQRKNILVCIPVCLVLGKRNVWRKLKRIMC